MLYISARIRTNTLSCQPQLHLQIKMARPQVNAQQQTPGQFGGRGTFGGRGGFTGRGGRGGRGYDQGYGYSQYGAGYDASGGYSAAGAGYGYDANGGYGYGGGYSQYPAGVAMVPMMMANGQVRFCLWLLIAVAHKETKSTLYVPEAAVVACLVSLMQICCKQRYPATGGKILCMPDDNLPKTSPCNIP